MTSLSPNRRQLMLGVAAATLITALPISLHAEEATRGGVLRYATLGLDTSDPHRHTCLLYTSPSPRDRQKSRMPSSA